MGLFPALGLAFVLATLPAIVYALFIWWLDRHEKEPLWLLAVAFLWGAVPAIVLGLVLEIVASGPLEGLIGVEGPRKIAEMGLVAPIVEEAVKALILVVLFLVFKREFDNVLDGVVYGALVGLGFSVVENILYLTSVGTDSSSGGMIQLWLLRSGLFGLNHSMFTALTGAALGYARSLPGGWRRGLVASVGLGAAMVMHAIHNTLISLTNVLPENNGSDSTAIGVCLGATVSDFGGLIVVLVIAIISGVRETRIIGETMWEEVQLGRLTPYEYQTLISNGKRWSARWSALFSGGPRRWRQVGKLFDLTSELAFRKHRMFDGSIKDQQAVARDIARLRYEIDGLRAAVSYG